MTAGPRIDAPGSRCGARTLFRLSAIFETLPPKKTHRLHENRDPGTVFTLPHFARRTRPCRLYSTLTAPPAQPPAHAGRPHRGRARPGPRQPPPTVACEVTGFALHGQELKGTPAARTFVVAGAVSCGAGVRRGAGDGGQPAHQGHD